MWAVVSRMVSEGSAWRWPMAKSLGSCAGVTLTAARCRTRAVPTRRPGRGFPRLGLPLTRAQWQRDDLADEGGVAFVGRVHRYGGVAKHGFGPRGGNDDGACAVGKPGTDVVELADAVFVRDLKVGDGGLLDGVPVDDVAARDSISPCSYSRRRHPSLRR